MYNNKEDFYKKLLDYLNKLEHCNNVPKYIKHDFLKILFQILIFKELDKDKVGDDYY